jgi:hypothetical protein
MRLGDTPKLPRLAAKKALWKKRKEKLIKRA